MTLDFLQDKNKHGIVRLSNNCSIDLSKQTVHRNGKVFRLSDIEYRILFLLISRSMQPVDAEFIIKEIWINSPSGNLENLRVQIGKIRRRIESNPSNPKYLVSIRGTGYMLFIKNIQLS